MKIKNVYEIFCLLTSNIPWKNSVFFYNYIYIYILIVSSVRQNKIMLEFIFNDDKKFVEVTSVVSVLGHPQYWIWWTSVNKNFWRHGHCLICQWWKLVKKK